MNASFYFPSVGLLIALLLVSTPAYAQLGDEAFAEIDRMREQGQYQEALAALDSLEQQHSESADVLWRRARTRIDLGEQVASENSQKKQYRAAIEDARTAVEADPESADAHLALAMAAGRVALISGTREKVELSRDVKKHVDRAIALDPDNDLAYHVRGRWNYGVADLGWFSRAIVKTVYGGLPDASFEQAAADLEKALSIDEKIAHHLELGKTYMKLDREDAARAQFEQALNMENVDPQDPFYKEEARRLLEEVS